MMDESTTRQVWTIGHSTRSIEELVATLRSARIELIVDVRRHPGSRRLPQFDSAALQGALERSGVAYHWIAALGGRRRQLPATDDLAWTHPAFRAYAHYLDTEEFAEGLFELLMLAGGLRTAIMCAEILWWRCHRRLIADVLVTLGLDVVHLFDATKSARHRLTSPARLQHGQLSYRRVP
jgi:uncharacterized protein (DUF488 family)